VALDGHRLSGKPLLVIFIHIVREHEAMDTYEQFLENKQRADSLQGFEPTWMPDSLFDFQKTLTDWAIRSGRCALFEDCGLGKTIQQLVWAENVVRHTNRPVLLVTPLAVGSQTISEAEKFGIDAERSRDGNISGSPRIVVTNYEQLKKFDNSLFSGIVCDESSAIKNFKSQRKQEVTEFCRLLKYRLLCTATAAPNDYHELGTSSDALGYLGYRDMLTMFFKQDTQKDHLGWGRVKYRFRGHAQKPFWRWVCSWARSIRKPSDIGGDDSRFELPPLNQHEHIVETKKARDGMLFAMAATNLQEQRAERRNSIGERCELAAEIATSHKGASVLWCELNDEGDRLVKEVPDAVQVKGSMSDEKKEEILTAFTRGEVKRLVTKPKIGCWGLNWQHCNKVICFPSHSFEQHYQAVRRCWRFGQENPVDVHMIVNEGEQGVLKNIQRKTRQSEQMFESLCEHMSDSLALSRGGMFDETEKRPSWL
jgi:hypothetical protein